MEKVFEFIKKCGSYYIATVDDGKPRVHPFGTINIFDNKMYIQTAREKACFKQMENQVCELACFHGSDWLRLSGTLVVDDRIEAQVSMLDSHPVLKRMYQPGDGNLVVLYFKNSKATFYPFNKEPYTIEF